MADIENENPENRPKDQPEGVEASSDEMEISLDDIDALLSEASPEFSDANV